MTYDQAYSLITWCIILVVGIPCLWLLWNWLQRKS